MENYRKQLNKIDKEMLDLFIERLDVIKDIKAYKEKHKLSILDKSREDSIISNGLSKINNQEYHQYYQEFMETLFKISKNLQSK